MSLLFCDGVNPGALTSRKTSNKQRAIMTMIIMRDKAVVAYALRSLVHGTAARIHFIAAEELGSISNTS